MANQWKIEIPFFYRERTYSHCKHPGHASLKHSQLKKFKRSRNTSTQNIDDEKIHLTINSKPKICYQLPPLSYPVIRQDITLEEYNKTIDDRIQRENHKKMQHAWSLPPINFNEYNDKFSVKQLVSSISLKKSIPKFQE